MSATWSPQISSRTHSLVPGEAPVLRCNFAGAIVEAIRRIDQRGAITATRDRGEVAVGSRDRRGFRLE